MSAKKNFGRICTAIGVSVIMATGLTGVANARNQDKVQDIDELIYFYNSDFKGAWSDFDVSRSNLDGYSYIGGGTSANGFGSKVKNNAASVRNRDPEFAVYIYSAANMGGNSFKLAAGTQKNLSTALKNKNASHTW
ncbi:peptidase inhibitor family I36 protein [Tessaracoccus caeni]|uniref:peptidase inhibitor family I36 protein n=1 Tax=Tessaracoccus caeni TaxID=3031239 RepID=UPI0023DBC0AE|nr:peptidase inhibitor family I36 protein [Tessaracoccus caeni]MDF1488923.1 peptidase inhibitor family I36 protein [Tessaracoccus caeni]